MKYIEILAADRRLAILRLLKDYGGSSNTSVLNDGLALLGHRLHTRDDVTADVRLLKDHGLIVDEWCGSVQVCTITQRGLDVADGRIHIEGVKKPSIGI